MPTRSLRIDTSYADQERVAEPPSHSSSKPAVAERATALTPVRVVSRSTLGTAARSARRARYRAADLHANVLAPHPRWMLVAKRLIDIVGATTGLVLFVPVLAVLAVLIRVGSPGRAIFAHERIGQRGRRFKCYKLRTMCSDAEVLLDADGPLRRAYEANHYKLPSDADPRVTRLGRFLRASSLDEIPQFWNVLRGDMSLVGPRPVVENELRHYGAARDVLLLMRPGVTGAWAVRGRSRIGYPDRAAIELEYVHTWTIRGDFAILARTVGVVLQRRGAY